MPPVVMRLHVMRRRATPRRVMRLHAIHLPVMRLHAMPRHSLEIMFLSERGDLSGSPLGI